VAIFWRTIFIVFVLSNTDDMLFDCFHFPRAETSWCVIFYLDAFLHIPFFRTIGVLAWRGLFVSDVVVGTARRLAA